MVIGGTDLAVMGRIRRFESKLGDYFPFNREIHASRLQSNAYVL